MLKVATCMSRLAHEDTNSRRTQRNDTREPTAEREPTKLHAEHLLAGGGGQEAGLRIALQVHAVRLKVTKQQLAHPLRCGRQRLRCTRSACRRSCCTLRGAACNCSGSGSSAI